MTIFMQYDAQKIELFSCKGGGENGALTALIKEAEKCAQSWTRRNVLGAGIFGERSLDLAEEIASIHRTDFLTQYTAQKEAGADTITIDPAPASKLAFSELYKNSGRDGREMPLDFHLQGNIEDKQALASIDQHRQIFGAFCEAHGQASPVVVRNAEQVAINLKLRQQYRELAKKIRRYWEVESTLKGATRRQKALNADLDLLKTALNLHAGGGLENHCSNSKVQKNRTIQAHEKLKKLKERLRKGEISFTELG